MAAKKKNLKKIIHFKPGFQKFDVTKGQRKTVQLEMLGERIFNTKVIYKPTKFKTTSSANHGYGKRIARDMAYARAYMLTSGLNSTTN